MTDQEFKLASEFSDSTYDAWRELAEKALKGAPFDKKLVTQTADGFKINPLYTAQDFAGDRATIHDRLLETIAAKSAVGAEKPGWDIRQLHSFPDPKSVNAAILEDLENGANSIELVFDLAAQQGGDSQSETAGQDGVMIYNRHDLDLALKGVYTDLARVSLKAGQATLPAAALMLAQQNDNASTARIAFNYDPLGELARTGTLPTSIDKALQTGADFAATLSSKSPLATAIMVDTGHWYNAGATDGTELAIALATATTYLRTLVTSGLDATKAANHIVFNVSVGTDFFSGIAKLRALRLTWQRILDASGITGADIVINAVSAEHCLSKVDPWVNMLRTTVTTFAAGVGGANAVTCLPYDHLLGLPDSFSRRIARNTQLILEEESNLHRVLDPAGGSWFIENLTQELATTGWSKFQSIESEGGIAAKIQDGSLADEVAQMWKNREQRIATRRDPLTGVSEFPNIDEQAVETEQPDIAALKAQAESRHTSFGKDIAPDFEQLIEAASNGANIGELFSALYKGEQPVEIAPLPHHHMAESFEALRERANAHKQTTGKEPAIFLANIGRIAEHTARATFARNFFEAGGVRALSNNGFADQDALTKAFKESGTNTAVICGSDEQYGELAVEFAQSLKNAGATKIYLAGKPGDNKDSFVAAGIEDFVFVGADVLAVCSSVLDHLGVK